jgi:hypothetical protein
MRNIILPGLLCGFALASSHTQAGPRENPYSAIVARNPFGLREIPIPPHEPAKEIVTLPEKEIKITGLTTLLDRPVAMLELFDPKTKNTERPPLLHEGDPFGDGFTLVAIDPISESVRVRHHGMETTLDFVANGIKPTNPVTRPPAVLAATTSPPGRGITGPVPTPTSPLSREEILDHIRRTQALNPNAPPPPPTPASLPYK